MPIKDMKYDSKATKIEELDSLKRAAQYRNRMFKRKGVPFKIRIKRISVEHYQITITAGELVIIDVFRSSATEVFEVMWAFTAGVYATIDIK